MSREREKEAKPRGEMPRNGSSVTGDELDLIAEEARRRRRKDSSTLIFFEIGAGVQVWPRE